MANLSDMWLEDLVYVFSDTVYKFLYRNKWNKCIYVSYDFMLRMAPPPSTHTHTHAHTHPHPHTQNLQALMGKSVFWNPQSNQN